MLDNKSIGMYEDDLLSLQMIGDFYGVSRQAVKKYLNRRGVDTSKRKFEIECSICGKKFKRHRSYIRNTIIPTCSVQCYYQRIKNPDYNQNRHGQRIARKVVDELMMTNGGRLDASHVVHHIDGDTTNNAPDNLMVFKGQSDHMRWHRAGREKSGVRPVWGGPKVFKKATVAPTAEQLICNQTVEGSSPSSSSKEPKYTAKYKEKNPLERCDFCDKALRYCFC